MIKSAARVIIARASAKDPEPGVLDSALSVALNDYIAKGKFLETYVVEIEPNVTVEIASTYNARD